MASDYHTEVAAALVSQIGQGTAPWLRARPDSERYMPYSPVSGREFTGGNALWLMSQAETLGYSDRRWLTAGQAQSLGASVRTGEAPTAVQFWRTRGGQEPQVLAVAVFNGDQIDNMPTEQLREALSAGQRHAFVERVVMASGAKVGTAPAGLEAALYRRDTDTLELPAMTPAMTQDGYDNAVLRGLALWTGHPTRLDRDIKHPVNSAALAREELRAELTGLVLGDRLGLGHNPSANFPHSSAIASLIERDPLELFRAAADAERIVVFTQELASEREQEIENDAGIGMTKDATPDRMAVSSPERQFADALYERGLRPDRAIEMDGGLHRVPVEGDTGKQRSGAYIGHLDGRPAGMIQNFRSGEKVTWKAEGWAGPLRSSERAQMAKDAAARRGVRDSEQKHKHLEAVAQAQALWEGAAPATDHPYLTEKEVSSHGLRLGTQGQAISVRGADGRERQVSLAGQLFVPIAGAEGSLTSLQFIRDDGGKMFMRGGQVSGGHHIIGDLSRPGPVLIAEGYATAATVHELTERPVVVAFNAGNLMAVAQELRKREPGRAIFFAADSDHGQEAKGKSNVGREKAEQAARAVGGQVMLPRGGEWLGGTDWNDLAKVEGRDETRSELALALAFANRDREALHLAKTHGNGHDAGQMTELAGQSAQSRTPSKTLDLVAER